MAQTLRFTCRGICDSAQRGRDHVAVLESARKFLALLRIVPQPVQQLRESPLGRVHASAPLDGLQFLAVREFCNLGGFLFCAVIAPQVVVVKRRKICSNWNHAGARGVESNRLDAIAAKCLPPSAPPGGRCQRPHVIVVRLRGIVWIFAFSVQRIFGDRRTNQSAVAIDERDADTERAEIDSCDNGHQFTPQCEIEDDN